MLGLLPDLPAVFQQTGTPFPLPAGFTLPAPWPVLKVTDPATFFTAPGQDVRRAACRRAGHAGDRTGGGDARRLGAHRHRSSRRATTPAGTHDDPFRRSSAEHGRPR